MAINIRMTPIQHGPRKRLGLDLVEYTVAHVIHFAAANPKAAVPGWCSYSKKSIGEFVGVSERKVFEIVKKLEGALLVERHPETGHTRTTPAWFEAVETYAESAGGMQDLQGDPAESAGGGMQNLQTTSNTSSNKGNNPLTPTGGQGALFGEEEKPQGEKAPQKQDAGELYREFIGWMAIAVKKKLRGDSTSRGAFNQRLKEGYTMEDFRHAIKAAWEDDYHRKTGYKHLTAEYITRPAQMEKWVNVPLRSEARANRPTSSLDASEEERRARMRQMGITH